MPLKSQIQNTRTVLHGNNLEGENFLQRCPHFVLLRLCKKITHLTILVCSKVAAVLLCKCAASLTRQDRKFITSFKQVFRSDDVTCVEVAANMSRQVHCKRVEKKRVRIRTSDSNHGNRGNNPVASSIRPAKLRSAKITKSIIQATSYF
ncbi:hypothetical protein AVEN_90887-1 [Araneus ventricosus]|uniref:Uncharacterized protein n=1 Tax=Araneus ventricosus TaxID=182803 RepID=A0A4Y2VT82_ARAVE|nr:hypothetical protein AVEN_90887-1 [Araneus ventricosus]